MENYSRSNGALAQRTVWRWSSYALFGALLIAGSLIAGRRSPIGTRGAATSPAPERSYKTLAAQRATITLASGAQVALAPSTTIRVAGGHVRLDGQAVFTIPHRATSPFSVQTKHGTVTVLGTTFGVRTFDSDVVVGVAEGRVRVGSAVLTAGEIARLDARDITTIRDTTVTGLLSWTTGRLVYDRVPLLEVVRDIERWYGVRIVLARNGISAR